MVCLRFLFVLMICLCVRAEDNPLDTSDPFVGVFGDPARAVAIEISAADASREHYSGVITRGEKRFPFEATRRGESIEGTFRSGDQPFPFSATLAENSLRLISGQATHLLQRQAGTAAAAGEAPASIQASQTYKHPTGGMLRYPKDWSVRETAEALVLTAPQQTQDEVYVVTSEDAGGASRPDDPALLQKIDALVAQQFPRLTRSPQIEKLKSGDRDGAVLTWDGIGPTGVKVKARLYATILKGQVVSIVAIGAAERIAPREPVLAQIFSSFAMGDAQVDPALTGTWHYWSYSSSGLGGPNLSSTEIRRTLTLNRDGSFTMTGNTEAYISVKTDDAQAASASQHGNGLRGTWAAGGGRLYLTCDNGSSFSFGYRIQGQPGNRIVNMDSGSGKPQEWSEKRVEM